MIGKGKIEKSEEALCWLRGWVKPQVIKLEHLELIRYNEVSGMQRDGGKVNTDNIGIFSKLEEFKEPAIYRPLRLVMILFLISNIISMTPCRSFISNIMTEVDILNEQSLLLVHVYYIREYNI